MNKYPSNQQTPMHSGIRRPVNSTPNALPSSSASRQPQPVRKKKKYADKFLSTQVQELAPESHSYVELLSYEQKVDTMISRKKLDMQEAVKRPPKLKKKLRIFVSHTFIPGREPDNRGEEGIVPSWEMRIEGRILDDPANPSTSNGQSSTPISRPPQIRKKFSSFFKSLLVELDKDMYGPDNHLLDWHRTAATQETDGFQIRRPGDHPVRCTIILSIDYQPAKFKLIPKLSKILGMSVETRPKILEGIWQYIRVHRLQDSMDRDMIHNDIWLEEIFGCKTMRLLELPQRLYGVLLPPDPIVIPYTLEKVEPGMERAAACFDVEVEVDDPVRGHIVHPYTSSLDVSLEQRIFDLVDQINDGHAKYDMLMRFVANQHQFIQKWLIQQSHEIMGMNEYMSEGEVERRADTYYQPYVQEGAFRYIYTRIMQKRSDLERSLALHRT